MIENKLRAKLKGKGFDGNFTVSREEQGDQIKKWLEKKYKGDNAADLKAKHKIFSLFKK